MRRKAAVPKEERPVKRVSFATETRGGDRSSGRWIRPSCAGALSRSPDCGSCWPDCWPPPDSARSCSLLSGWFSSEVSSAGGLWLLRRYGTRGAPAGRPPVSQVALVRRLKARLEQARLAAASTAFRDPHFETGSRCFRSGQGLPGSHADPLEDLGLGRSGKDDGCFRSGSPHPGSREPELRHRGRPSEGAHVGRSSGRNRTPPNSSHAGALRRRPAVASAPAQRAGSAASTRRQSRAGSRAAPCRARHRARPR